MSDLAVQSRRFALSEGETVHVLAHDFGRRHVIVNLYDKNQHQLGFGPPVILGMWPDRVEIDLLTPAPAGTSALVIG